MLHLGAGWVVPLGVSAVLAVATVTDLRARKIPNALLIPAAAILVPAAYLTYPHALFGLDLVVALLSLAAYLAWGHSMGAGDAKLLALLCVAITVPASAALLFVPLAARLAASLVHHPAHGRADRALRTWPMAPFLAAAWAALWIALMAVPHLIDL